MTKQMGNINRMISIVLLALGIISILLSIYITHRVNEAKGEIGAVTGLFSHGEIVGNQLDKKADAYMPMAHVTRIGGIILILAGGGLLFYSLRKKG